MSGMTRSMPRSSDSGNIIPASMTMMSPPTRSAIIFMPNSPRPPRGMARRDCEGLLTKIVAPRCARESYHSANKRTGIGERKSVLGTAGKQMNDRNQHHGAERRRSQRVDKTSSKNAELGKNPSADDRADEAENDVRDAAVAAATGEFAGQPARHQPEEEPRKQRPGPPEDHSFCEERRNPQQQHESSQDFAPIGQVCGEFSRDSRRAHAAGASTAAGELLGHTVNCAEA